MSPPLISVVTPTFNCGGKIIQTMASVLSQEAGLFEYLIIDGGSTDNTVTHLREFEGGAMRWLSEPDAGIYDAMNKGIRLAQGKYIYFLGAGDRLRAGVLRAVANSLTITPDTRHLAYGDIHWPAYGGRYGGTFDGFRLAKQNISHQAIFYGRDIFALLGEFDLRFTICADFAMNIRCFGEPSIRRTYIPMVIADFEGGGTSDSVDQAFYNQLTSLAWRNLGPAAALHAAFHHSWRFRRVRWLIHQCRQPLRTLPNRIWRRLRPPRVSR